MAEERVLIAYTGEGEQERNACSDREDQGRGLSTSSATAHQLDSFMLRDPKTGQPQGVMLGDNHQLLEVHHFKQMYSSWFTQDRILADGSMYLCTPMDPLFPLLPILDKARNKTSDSEGVFSGLDQILTDGTDQCEGAERLAQAAARANLGCLCDVKEIGGDTYVRLNDKRALAWLTCKVEQAKQALCYQLANMDASSQVAYVVSFLAEYLPELWVERLAKQLDVEQQLKGAPSAPSANGPKSDSGQQPPEKKQKVDPKDAAKEAARKKAEETKAKQAAGTKKISSFFAPRPKI